MAVSVANTNAVSVANCHKVRYEALMAVVWNVKKDVLQRIITCSKLTVKALEQGQKYIQN